MQCFAKFHIVVTIYAQDVFYNVAWALHVNTVGRYEQLQLVGTLIGYFYFEALEYVLYGVVAYLLADEVIDIFISERDREWREILALYVNDFTAYFATCKLLDEHGSNFQELDCSVWVDAAFETER